MLPWQDVARSVAMVPSLVSFGMRGVEVGSNINGKSIADRQFDPVFDALAKAGLALFVHGSRPAGADRLLGPPLMLNVIGVPQDGTAALASFIATDVLGRHPALRVGFAHGGGAFAALLGRMDFVWRSFPAFRTQEALAPSDYVRRFFFDTITYSVPLLRFLADAFGGDTLMCGTDGPGRTQMPLAAFARQACPNDEVALQKMLSGNARRFLGLNS
jgi:aminocarboxymuconate-semialdehyde decarboxylase